MRCLGAARLSPVLDAPRHTGMGPVRKMVAESGFERATSRSRSEWVLWLVGIIEESSGVFFFSIVVVRGRGFGRALPDRCGQALRETRGSLPFAACRGLAPPSPACRDARAASSCGRRSSGVNVVSFLAGRRRVPLIRCHATSPCHVTVLTVNPCGAVPAGTPLVIGLSDGQPVGRVRDVVAGRAEFRLRMKVGEGGIVRRRLRILTRGRRHPRRSRPSRL